MFSFFFFFFDQLEISQDFLKILIILVVSNILAGFLVMFSLLAGAWQYMFEPREYYILILGIDNAGKTVRSYICNYTQYYTLKHCFSLHHILPLFISLLSATQRLDLIVHDTLVRVGKLRAFRLVSACSTLAHSTFR